MTDISTQVQSLDRETLAPVVRRALGRDSLEIMGWETTILSSAAGNPTSLGVWRFSGEGRDQGVPVTWSVILKAVQAQENSGWAVGGDTEDHFNYWRRELLAYQAALLDDLPAGITAPRCFGIVAQPGKTAWMWLEDVRGFGESARTEAHFAFIARALGRFHGAYLGERPLPQYAWLSNQYIRAWCDEMRLYAPGMAHLLADSNGVFSRFHTLTPAEDTARFLDCLTQPEPFLVALERLPQTLSHHDANPNNMFLCMTDSDSRLMILDWQGIGWGPLGEDAAQLLTATAANNAFPDVQWLERHLFDHYLHGLRDAGWHGDANAVRYGYAVSGALREGFFQLFLLRHLMENSPSPDAPSSAIDEHIDRSASLFRLLIALANDAHRLLPLV